MWAAGSADSAMKFITALVALALALPLAHAQRVPDTGPFPAQLQSAPPDERVLLTHDHYRAKNGNEVHSPAKSVRDQVPSGASAKCRDGTYSFSQHRQGTCSHHGGVAQWL